MNTLPPDGALIYLHADLDYARAGQTYRVTRAGLREWHMENVRRMSGQVVREWQLAAASYSIVQE